LSPESLLLPGGIERTVRHRPALIIVDEAHTIWEWGRGFRPAFQKIGAVLAAHNQAKSLWLSATLSSEARRAVLALLPSERVAKAHECGTTGIPPSLKISVENRSWRTRLERVLEFLEAQNNQPGVIFCPTRALTLQLAESLAQANCGFRSAAYHAGLSREERQSVEQDLARQRINLLCATSAFGMGIDLSHLRWCIVWEPPGTLLSLIQQMGRVTRSSKPGEALLFWTESDLIRWATRTTQNTQEEVEAFQSLTAFYRSQRCRRATLANALQGRQLTSMLPEPRRGLCEPPTLCDICRADRAAPKLPKPLALSDR